MKVSVLNSAMHGLQDVGMTVSHHQLFLLQYIFLKMKMFDIEIVMGLHDYVAWLTIIAKATQLRDYEYLKG